MNDGLRGIGGLLLALAAYLIAEQLGMNGWRLYAVAALVGVGVPMAVTGRWKDW